jgi:hypothetical protein
MRLLLPAAIALVSACSDVDNPDTSAGDQEVITTVVLTFTALPDGPASEFRWADPEYDGSPVIDPITLSDGADYTLDVAFLNELESPPEDLTIEVAAEGDQHQVFVLGSAVDGPATGDNPAAVVTHAYDDADTNGFPVGLTHTIGTLAPGAGSFEVVLRHLPPEDEVAVKTGTLAEDAAADGIGSLPGDTDAEVSFELTVE